MNINNGVFTVSLDFELYWGLRDKRAISEYEDHLNGVKTAIERTLELFDKYEIHATWATVGFLFAKNIEELKALSPTKKPNYHRANLSPYVYIENSEMLEARYHFAPELIDRICKYSNQEIGTHSFSHYYCLEKGQTKEEFGNDLAAAMNVAKEKGVSIESLVFPRNQWNDKYLSVLNECGIKSFRGNEKGWLYKAVNGIEENLVRRALRLLDAYINLSGSNSYSIKSISATKPYNIPSSRFLRPKSKRLSVFEGLRKRRIISSLEQAAKNNEIFHLWWHPHNFGADVDGNIEFLEDILLSFRDMNNLYGMKSLNMREVSGLIDNGESL